MNYKQIYNNLIDKARNRLLEGYTETHHIVPRCMGGSDDKDNLVDLTPEEHYVAHQLLVKMYPKNKALVNAAAMMIPNRPTNKMYGWLRRRLSETMSELQTGEKNNQYGTRWIHNKELKKSKKIPKTDVLPEGWEEGRKIKFTEKYRNCRGCGTPFVLKLNEGFCSTQCRRHHLHPYFKNIDDNIDVLIETYKSNNSIYATLSTVGIGNTNAVANKYFSDILKERNIEVTSRRYY